MIQNSDNSDHGASKEPMSPCPDSSVLLMRSNPGSLTLMWLISKESTLHGDTRLSVGWRAGGRTYNLNLGSVKQAKLLRL